MKKKLIHWFKMIFFFSYRRSNRDIEKVNKILGEAVKDKTKSQIELMQEIAKFIDGFYPKGRSKFIPLTWLQKREIYSHIVVKYSDRMKDLNVKMSKELKFI
jgi:hypothetical protein